MQAIEKTKRRRFTQEQKNKILNELNFGSMTIVNLARKHGIAPVTLHMWKRNMPNSTKPKRDDDYNQVLSENEKLKIENDNLKKALGEMAVDNQILKTYTDVLKKNQRKEKLKKRKK
jgi:transposase-like protein